MIGVNDLTDEINRLMVSAFPSAQAHINLCPERFQRPAYLIRCARISRTDASRTTVLVTAYFTIVYFVPVDEHQISDTAALSDAQAAVMDLFGAGYITVGTRKIKAKSQTGGMDFEEAYVDVQFEFYDDRAEEAEEADLMAAVETRTTLRWGE